MIYKVLQFCGKEPSLNLLNTGTILKGPLAHNTTWWIKSFRKKTLFHPTLIYKRQHHVPVSHQ